MNIRYNSLPFPLAVKFPDIRNLKAFYTLMLPISNMKLEINNFENRDSTGG